MIKHILTTALALVVLASCGATDRLAQLAMGQSATPEQADITLVSAEEMLANPGTYVRVNIRNQEAWASFTLVGQNGLRKTWIAPQNLSLTFENGIVVATRGLPRDLMGAEVSQVWDAIQRGGGTAQRQHDIITDQDGITTKLLQCSIASEGTESVTRGEREIPASRYKETCESETLIFTNIYWLNQQGNMIRSLQAVTPDAGYLQIDVF